MKRRLFALLMAAILVFSLAACSGGSDATEPAGTEAAGGTEAAEGTEAAGGETTGTIKVGMVTDVGGINDQSFNQSSWEGLQRAQEELGIDPVYVESHQDSEYATNIESLIDADCDLIICVGYMLADATREAAEMYPDQKFAIIDDNSNADLPNVACLMFEQEQASYLVGIVAGMMTESNTVGFVLGQSTGPMNEFGYGYVDGVLSTNPDATVLQYNTNAFGDAGLGKTAAKDMITNGADVIYHAAGGTGAGVIEACAEDGVWAIGVDSDQNHLAPETVVTSAMKRVDNASYDIAKAVLEGTYTPGEHVYSLEDGGVDIAPTTTLLPDDVLAAVETAKQQIIDGEIVVPATQEEFEEKYGPDVYQLDPESAE